MMPAMPMPHTTMTTTNRAARNKPTNTLSHYHGQHWSCQEGYEDTAFYPHNYVHIEELIEDEDEDDHTRSSTIASSQRKLSRP